jgi:hypothetical protein
LGNLCGKRLKIGKTSKNDGDFCTHTLSKRKRGYSNEAIIIVRHILISKLDVGILD